jgi:hypothetical protein
MLDEISLIPGRDGVVARHHRAMRTRSVVLATTLTVGLVAGVGSSALAIAFVPGDSSGVTEGVQAIASPTQDPAEGSVSWFIESTPVTLTVAEPVVIDGGPVAKPAPSTEAPSTEATPTEATPTEATPTEANAQKDAAEHAKKAAEDQAKKDKAAEEQAKKAAEDQAKKDKAKKDAEDKAKKDKKAAEEQAKKDKAKKDKENQSEDDEDDE